MYGAGAVAYFVGRRMMVVDCISRLANSGPSPLARPEYMLPAIVMLDKPSAGWRVTTTHTAHLSLIAMSIIVPWIALGEWEEYFSVVGERTEVVADRSEFRF